MSLMHVACGRVIFLARESGQEIIFLNIHICKCKHRALALINKSSKKKTFKCVMRKRAFSENKVRRLKSRHTCWVKSILPLQTKSCVYIAERSLLELRCRGSSFKTLVKKGWEQRLKSGQAICIKSVVRLRLSQPPKWFQANFMPIDAINSA